MLDLFGLAVPEPADAGIRRDASDGELPTLADADPPLDASPDREDVVAPLNCDRDNDGFRSKTDACGGFDCDDLDPRVKPDSGFVNAARDDAGDWNCDGTTEYEIDEFDVDETCPIVGGFFGLDNRCKFRRGWIGRPACGTNGERVECVQRDANCELKGKTKWLRGAVRSSFRAGPVPGLARRYPKDIVRWQAPAEPAMGRADER